MVGKYFYMPFYKLLVVVGALLAAGGARANLISTTSYQFSASANGGTGGTVSETIATTPGLAYVISFQASMSGLYTPTSLNFLFGDLVNQTLMNDLGHQYSLWYFNQASTPAATFNYLVTADSANTALTFQYALTSENYGLSVRNLSVNAVPDAASTAALLSLAGTGIFLTRRWLNKLR